MLAISSVAFAVCDLGLCALNGSEIGPLYLISFTLALADVGYEAYRKHYIGGKTPD